MGSVNTVGYKYTYANLQNRLWWSSVEKCCTSFLNTFVRLFYNHDAYTYSLYVIKIANKISPTYVYLLYLLVICCIFTNDKNANYFYEMKHLVRLLKLRPTKKFQYNAYSKKTSDFVGQVYARTFYMVE